MNPRQRGDWPLCLGQNGAGNSLAAARVLVELIYAAARTVSKIASRGVTLDGRAACNSWSSSITKSGSASKLATGTAYRWCIRLIATSCGNWIAIPAGSFSRSFRSTTSKGGRRSSTDGSAAFKLCSSWRLSLARVFSSR